MAEQQEAPPFLLSSPPGSMLVVAVAVRVLAVISTDTLQGYLPIEESESGRLGFQTRS